MGTATSVTFAALLAAAPLAAQQDREIGWLTDLDVARTRAAESDKPLLIVFR